MDFDLLIISFLWNSCSRLAGPTFR